MMRTIPEGVVLTATSGITCPIIIRPIIGCTIELIIGTMSPCTTGRLRTWRFIISTASSLNRIAAPSGGARTTFFASLTSAFLTTTRSPIPTSAFCRVNPSTLMIFCSQSCLSARHTFAAVTDLPFISTISPGESFNSNNEVGSRRAMPLAESIGYAFATFK